ncbi:MAG: SIR2 family protein, partial [Nanoarchaeota archaeon]|nr:SIR2 family protein [Nanoarchaeota archaeon]
MTTLLFLGAGSSQPFGIPTMTQIVTKFEERLKKENIKGRYLYSTIKESLKKGFDISQIDIESIFSVIIGIAEEIQPQKMGYYTYYYLKKFSSEHKFSQTEIDESKNLRDELEKFIQTECKIRNESIDIDTIYKNSFDELFRNIWGVKKQFNPKNVEYAVGWNAYTTNYDTIFESYWKELKPPLDYFNRSDTQTPYFDSTRDILNQQNTFMKLHGSIDWTVLENGEILEDHPDLYIRTKRKGRAMLYPIQQKDLYLHPWTTLFQHLRHGLKTCDLWYVIGYGFNDEFVLNSFIEAFSDKKRLIIINPHAKDLVKKFPEKYHQYITLLPIKFGNEKFPKQFEDFNKGIKTLLCKVKTKSRLIGLTSNFRILRGEIIETEKVTQDAEAEINAEQSWITIPIYHPGDKEEIHLSIEVEHESPYDKDLELIPAFNGVYDYDVSIYIQDQFRASGYGNTSEQDQESQLHLGKP